MVRGQVLALQQLDSAVLVDELNRTQNDSLTVKLLNALCWKNYSINPNIALAFAEQQLAVVDRIGYEAARIPANDNLAHVYKRLGKYEASSEHLLRSLEAYRTNKDTAGMIVSGFGVGNVLFELDGEPALEVYKRYLNIIEDGEMDIVQCGWTDCRMSEKKLIELMEKRIKGEKIELPEGY